MEKTHRRNIHFTLRTTRKLLLTKLAIRRLFLLKYVTLSYLLVISIKRAEALINTPPPPPWKGKCASVKITRNYCITFNSSSSDQRLVCQCPVQPSCRLYEVPWWKTDCAYPRAILYLPAGLLPYHWKDSYEGKRQSDNHDSDPWEERPWYRVRRRDFQPESWWRHYDDFGWEQLETLHGHRAYLLWRLFDLKISRMSPCNCTRTSWIKGIK